MEERAVTIGADGVLLVGDLAVPLPSRGVVLFAHGSGSGRQSPRNRKVARALGDAGFATLLLDLLTEDEDRRADLRFDIGLLADRLRAATRWLRQDPSTSGLRIGYFGASTGAAAAIAASVRHPNEVVAVVSRGGRPDLAGDAVESLKVPTRLIVGSLDRDVLRANENAFTQMPVEAKDLAIVTGATHRFDEPGALDEVARLATDWFSRYLAVHPSPDS